ncbi:MAG TPA: helix-turn-helix domain-containing protein [Candidatus Limnocylindrales bacterium]|nr:helix-turn-helix domain-containing protein [Candidatus Limnocylindrales bacterium]
MAVILDREPVGAPGAELAAVEAVAAILEGDAEVRLCAGDEAVALPDVLRLVVAQAARELVRGNQVTLVPVGRMLTTRQAAELLNVSRPFVIRLLEQGRIPFEMVGTHRRIPLEAVLRYRAERSARRRAVLRELSAEADELGDYTD